MIRALWCLVLAASMARAADSAAVAERPGLSVLALTHGQGIDPAIAASLTEALAAEAERTGSFQVTSAGAVQTMLGIERQKSLLGCSEESSSCMMELAQALGSRFALAGSLVKLGSTWQLNLQMLDTRKAVPVGRSTRIANELDTIRAQLPWAVAEATGTPAPQAPSRVLPYTLMIGGGAALVASGVLFLQSFAQETSTRAELNVMGVTLSRPATYFQEQIDQIVTTRIVASIVAGAGVALFAVGLVLNPKSDALVRVSLVPGFGGAMLVGVMP